MNLSQMYLVTPPAAFRHPHTAGPARRWFFTWLLSAAWLGAMSSVTCAQREYTVEKPRERGANEKVIIRKAPTQPTEGVLAVVLDPIIAGKVVVKDAAGNVITEAEADEKTGQAEFQLRRGRIYHVEANSPGYLGAASKSEALKASAIVRLKLKPEFAALKLRGLPASAQVLIDDQPRATADQTGGVTIADLAPGNHTLTIRHPEYNDFRSDLGHLEAGDQVSYPSLPLVKVAKLTLKALPGAAVLIDGERRGEIQADGTVTISYQLDRASEHSIAVELVGYQTWSRREQLTPGARTIAATLEPIVTSAGVGDIFDDLSLWAAPPAWKILSESLPNGKRNGKLVVSGSQLGTPKETNYRDFDANFTIWLPDGKGASWALRVDQTARNYYLFYLAGPKAETPNKFYTYLVKDGQLTQASTPIQVVADLNQKSSYTIDISVHGFTIKHEITSNATGERNDLGIYTDTKRNFLYGTFGFRSFKGESFVVDDFTLQPKEPEKVGSLNQ